MRPFFFFLLLLSFIIILSNEKENKNKTLNKTESKNTEKKSSKKKEKKEKKDKNKKQKKEKEKDNEESNPLPPLSFKTEIIDPYNLPNDDVYMLTDITVDKALQNGNNYRWLVILFSQTCGHCYFARSEIRKIVPEFKNSPLLRFAELEININPMSNMRFNIEGVPYIFILQNNTMYLMDLYPSQKNIMKFLGIDLGYFLPEEKKPFPPPVNFKNNKFNNVFQDMTNSVNEFLTNYGIKFQFTSITLIVALVSGFSLICFLDYFCCVNCCPDIEEPNEDEKDKEKENNKKNDNKSNEKENENEGKVDENKEISEEEKIKREKEKENIEKEKNKNKNQKKGEKIKDKKKKN